RKKDTAQVMAKIPELQRNVEKLSKEESWSLFEKHENVSSKLELVGKEIVEKCNGLPLAVKTVGEEMSKDSLIELWLANGFIPSQGGEKTLSCLVQRSFFQDVVEEGYEYTGEKYKMHDLKFDVAKSDGARIGELGNLNLLGSELTLSRLENV
ncbi:disease resistance protein, partial [Tanacetum coccineum]